MFIPIASISSAQWLVQSIMDQNAESHLSVQPLIGHRYQNCLSMRLRLYHGRGGRKNLRVGRWGAVL